MTWLRLIGEPVRVFHNAATDRALLAGQGRPHELLLGLGSLRSGIDGETPNIKVTLANGSGQCARLFAVPPIGAVAELRDATGVLFAGTVHDVSMDAGECVLGIETLLTRPLPLRISTIWGGFREAVPLPHRYGTCSGGLIQYNDARTIFCWADHACEAIDEVRVGGQPAGEWQWYTLVDSSNHTITVVEFGHPVDEGVELLARGRGKLHPNPPGQRMTNPGTVIWDVLANLGGWAITESQIEDFTRECARLGIEVGGSIESASDTPQGIVRAICDSIGAAFCADAPGLCRLQPDPAMPSARARVRDGVVSAEADLDAMANDLTVQYGFSSDDPSGSVQLDAPDYVARYGRRAESLAAHWITSPRVAYAVAERLLTARARPRYAVTVEAIPGTLQVFDSVQLEHAALPVSGAVQVLSREVAQGARKPQTKVTAMATVGEAPALRLVRQAVAFEAAAYLGATSQTIGTDRVYTITEADGRPVVGAEVTANGFTRSTDVAGRVVFPISALPPGNYVFQIFHPPTDRRWPYPTVVT